MKRASFSSRSLAWAVPIVAEAAALGRSIAFAWAIGADELGRAMVLALTIRLVEMISDLGIDRLLVQASDGDDVHFQSALHGVSVLRGVFGCGLVLILAPVLALMFADGPTTGTYAVLAIIPLVRGCAHLDFKRAERQFSYTRLAWVEGGATIAMLLALGPALWSFPDHRAMPAVLIAHACAFVTLSHVVALRPYRVIFCQSFLRRTWTFGAPLILNAGLMFLTFYADRLIVARAFDWSVLALYGVALQLAMLPAQIVGRAAGSLVLPRFRIALSDGTFAQVWPRILMAHAIMAAIMVIGFASIAPDVIVLAYGADLRPDIGLAVAFALAAAFRILRTPFSQFSIAVGRTSDPARANLIRALAVIPALGFAMAGFPLIAIAAAAALGEAGATLRAFFLAVETRRAGTHQEVLV
ncbi:oligosaccharide flippase family protein [Shimia abyssi]|uniref:O-antigen/teichoic acid export membrane protein n=1 Tax=Shimia abyssi TaxID=1662395 RepID=A0A2P8FJU1_9RHOB|nr:oligosaccharide flippase family protein [Shimia abyssi]PSL21968.1 O-antigen/teichoic acid export membrane protein [Shimia abyssi]